MSRHKRKQPVYGQPELQPGDTTVRAQEISEIWAIFLNSLNPNMPEEQRASLAAAYAQTLFDYPGFENPLPYGDTEMVRADFISRMLVCSVTSISNGYLYEAINRDKSIKSTRKAHIQDAFLEKSIQGKVRLLELLGEYCDKFSKESNTVTYGALSTILENALHISSNYASDSDNLRIQKKQQLSNDLVGMIGEFMICEGLKDNGFPLSSYAAPAHDMHFEIDVIARTSFDRQVELQVKAGQEFSVTNHSFPARVIVPTRDYASRLPGFKLHPAEVEQLIGFVDSKLK